MNNDQLTPGDTGIIFFLIVAIVLTGLFTLAFWTWMLVDCIKNELPGSREKIMWVVLIVFFGLIGAFAYNVGRRKQRIRELGR